MMWFLRNNWENFQRIQGLRDSKYETDYFSSTVLSMDVGKDGHGGKGKKWKKLEWK